MCKEGWATTLRGGHKAKLHYYRLAKTGYVSLCSQHAQRADFTPLAHPPLRALCCKACLRYLLVAKKEA